MSHFMPNKLKQLMIAVGFCLFFMVAAQPSVVLAQVDQVSQAASNIRQLRMSQIEDWSSTPDNLELLDVSVVSEKVVQEIFQQLARIDLTHNYPNNGCHARAHKMVRILEQEGIIGVKIFILTPHRKMKVKTLNSPKGYVEWGFHVAPAILVDVNGEEVPYIIDPALFDQAVPYSVWLDLLKKDSKPDIKFDEYVTKRTIYHWSQINVKDYESTRYFEYTDTDLKNMNTLLDEIAKKQRIREQQFRR